MNKTSRVFVLAEDTLHQRFIYHVLRQARVAPHAIRFKVAPEGRGSAEQWVREHYSQEVKEFRTRAARTCLVVLIDADRGEVRHRERQLQEALERAQMEKRSDREQIAHLIPKRHIETWLLCLNGIDTSEDFDYKRRRDVDPAQLLKPAAEAFFEGSHRNSEPPPHWIDSLLRAIPEVRRLD